MILLQPFFRVFFIVQGAIHSRCFALSLYARPAPYSARQGGSGILEAVRGAEDITAMFESYHAMANVGAIRESLEKFEWKGQV